MIKRTITAKKRPAPRDVVFSLRGSPEWKKWVDLLAKHCRTDVAKLIDSALVDYARTHGFDRQAPER
jgi:hypothetical protein